MSKIGRPAKWTNAALLSDACDAYFAKCQETSNIPTKTGLALALNVSADTLRSYEAKPRFSATLKKCDSLIEEAWVQAARLEKGSKQVFAIFYLKAKHGWQDRQEYNITGGLSLTDLFEKAQKAKQ